MTSPRAAIKACEAAAVSASFSPARAAPPRGAAPSRPRAPSAARPVPEAAALPGRREAGADDVRPPGFSVWAAGSRRAPQVTPSPAVKRGSLPPRPHRSPERPGPPREPDGPRSAQPAAVPARPESPHRTAPRRPPRTAAAPGTRRVGPRRDGRLRPAEGGEGAAGSRRARAEGGEEPPPAAGRGERSVRVRRGAPRQSPASRQVRDGPGRCPKGKAALRLPAINKRAAVGAD